MDLGRFHPAGIFISATGINDRSEVSGVMLVGTEATHRTHAGFCTPIHGSHGW